MKAQTILIKDKRIFCSFEGVCEFKKYEPRNKCTTCMWKGYCNQQSCQKWLDSNLSSRA